MVSDLVDIIKDRISDAVYVDRLAGLVTTINYEDLGKDKKTIIKRIPAACDVDSLNCGEDSSRYKDLVPDSSKRSVIFFEENTGVVFNNKDRFSNNYTATVRLVGWINQQKLGKDGCNVAGPIINDLIERIHSSKLVNAAPYTKIKFSVIRMLPKTPAIFSKYTFPLTEMQYLMFPYDYFAMDIGINYNMNPKCLNEYVLGPIDECLDK